MGFKYHCDDCGIELGEFDNVANQLDIKGKAYCGRCKEKHVQKEPTVYKLSQQESRHINKIYGINALHPYGDLT